MSSPPQMVLFDIGGVLADLRPSAAARSWREVMGAGSDVFDMVEGSGAKAEGDRGRLDEAGMCARVGSRLGRSVTVADLRRTWGAMVGWRPWVASLLGRLQVPYGVLSNICPVHAAVLGPLPGAQPIIYSCEVGAMKPERAIYEAALARIDLPPSRVLYLDDLAENVRAGAEAGFLARRVTDRRTVTEALAGLLKGE